MHWRVKENFSPWGFLIKTRSQKKIGIPTLRSLIITMRWPRENEKNSLWNHKKFCFIYVCYSLPSLRCIEVSYSTRSTFQFQPSSVSMALTRWLLSSISLEWFPSSTLQCSPLISYRFILVRNHPSKYVSRSQTSTRLFFSSPLDTHKITIFSNKITKNSSTLWVFYLSA